MRTTYNQFILPVQHAVGEAFIAGQRLAHLHSLEVHLTVQGLTSDLGLAGAPHAAALSTDVFQVAVFLLHNSVATGDDVIGVLLLPAAVATQRLVGQLVANSAMFTEVVLIDGRAAVVGRGSGVVNGASGRLLLLLL